MAMAKQLAVQVHNPGGALRVVSTKPMPGMQWIKALTNVGCRVEVSTLHTISMSILG
jgi:hydroxypyruvate reductase 1